MKQEICQILENRPLTDNVYRMRLSCDTSAFTAPGQFVNLQLDGLYLRRPISVCDLKPGELTIIYKTVGQGTVQMASLLPGKCLDVLLGLGNGYDTAAAGDRPLLIGGGVGVPPMYLLTKTLAAQKKQVRVLMGFNTASEVFYEKEFQNLGVDVTVTTVDGSYGTRGFVTDAFPENYSYYYACGPEPMLKAVWKKAVTDGELSFEKRMGCGFGACMGCSCKTITGYKRICKDGPVLKKGEIKWED